MEEKSFHYLVLFTGLFLCLLHSDGVSSSCDNINQIDFAEITYEPEGLAPHPDGTVASIECGVFYQILPTAFERTTCTDGSWTGPLPRCRHVPRYCQRNEALVQIYGQDCQTPCRNRLNGACPGNKQCHCDGLCGWSCISIYEENFCPEVADQAGLLVTYDPPERRFNGFADFSCGDGYIYHSGSSRLLCKSNRQWGGGNDFLCIPNGVSTSCDNINQIDFAEITYEPEGLAPHPDGTVASIECGVFYQIVPTAFERTTCTDGSWTGPLPQCRHVPRYCQRNDGLVQIYRRDCQAQCRNRPNGGCPGNKRCHCDGVCGWSCISIYEDDFCPEVADQAGLLVTYDPPERRFNGYADFSCGEGYIYHFGSSRLLCMSNRQWSGGNDFLCIPNDNQNPVITCPADLTSDTLTVSFTVNVTDNVDPTPALTYDPLGPGSIFPLGPTTVTVTAIDSSSNQDSCTFTVTVIEIICEDPGVPVNGYKTNAKQVYHLDDVIYYHCNEGNTMDGSILNSCTESGEWRHPVPVCGASCNAPDLPDHMMTAQFESHFPHGTLLNVSCEYGFQLSMNQEQLRCHRGGWSPPLTATCQRVPCGHPVRASYSTIEILPGVQGYVHGTRVRYSCREGWEIEGIAERECVNGQWTGSTPACRLADRMERLCSKPGYISHVVQYVNGLETSKLDTYPHDELPEGTFLVSRCSLPGQYVLRGANRTCTGGSWTGEEPSCDDADTTISFHNDQPLDVRSNGTIVIHPRSRLYISCHVPSHNIARFESENGPYAVYRGLSTMIMSLNPPRTSDSGRFTCRSNDNTLSHTVYVQFAEIFCDRPTAPTNGAFQDYDYGWKNGRYYMGKVITFACNDGYILDGERRITCVLGEWSHPAPRCQRHRTTCEELHPPTHGTKVGGNRINDSVLIGCNQGYQLQGEPFLDCQESGNWSHPVPSCVEIVESEGPCDSVSCEVWQKCETNSSGVGVCRCISPHSCPVTDEPVVCGTDGRNYTNLCRLKALACIRKTGVEVASRTWFCINGVPERALPSPTPFIEIEEPSQLSSFESTYEVLRPSIPESTLPATEGPVLEPDTPSSRSYSFCHPDECPSSSAAELSQDATAIVIAYADNWDADLGILLIRIYEVMAGELPSWTEESYQDVLIDFGAASERGCLCPSFPTADPVIIRFSQNLTQDGKGQLLHTDIVLPYSRDLYQEIRLLLEG